MLRLPLLFIFLVGLTTGCIAQPTTVREPGRYQESISVGGLERSYIVRVPKAIREGRPLPVVFVLHGYTASAALAEVYTGMARAEDLGYLVVFPDGAGRPQGWNVGFLNLSSAGVDDVAFFRSLLDRLEKDFPVDRSRVFVAGHSNGAMLAHRLAVEVSERIAAIAAVAGTVGLSEQRRLGKPKGEVAVLMIHGAKDNVVAFDGSVSALLRGIAQPVGARWWAEQLGTANVSVRTKIGDNVDVDTWPFGRRGTEVVLMTSRTGEHEWPGGFTRQGRETLSGLDATDQILKFFARHRKQSTGLPVGQAD